MRVRATVALRRHRVRRLRGAEGRPAHGRGTLADAIGRVLGQPVELTCAGRTDAGVHAWGQVVSFDADEARLDTVALERAVNKMLRPAIAIRDVARRRRRLRCRASPRRAVATGTRSSTRPCAVAVPRRDVLVDRPAARSRGDAPCVRSVDRRARLQLVLSPAVAGGDARSSGRSTRRGRSVDTDDGCLLRFWIEANAFCHQMVRSIVGTMVDVGLGRRRAGDVAAIMRALDRAEGGQHRAAARPVPLGGPVLTD